MGANMARRLKDCGFSVTAVYDVHAPSAAALAREIGAKAARKLADVTKAADVVFTVVTDDSAQLRVFAEDGDSLLGAALGLDLDMLREVFSQTGANSQVLKTDGEDMQNRAHDCYFSAAHAAKDSTIAWTLGAETGLSLPLAAATKLQFDRMVALGLGQLDKSGVAELTFKGRHA